MSAQVDECRAKLDRQARGPVIAGRGVACWVVKDPPGLSQEGNTAGRRRTAWVRGAVQARASIGRCSGMEEESVGKCAHEAGAEPGPSCEGKEAPAGERTCGAWWSSAARSRPNLARGRGRRSGSRRAREPNVATHEVVTLRAQCRNRRAGSRLHAGGGRADSVLQGPPVGAPRLEDALCHSAACRDAAAEVSEVGGTPVTLAVVRPSDDSTRFELTSDFLPSSRAPQR